MREILFRGKRCNNGEWVQGSYIRAEHHWHKFGIHEDWIALGASANGGWFTLHNKYAVKPETVGQYTGLKDKKGNRIFEGDIVRYKWDKGREYCHVIKFEDGEFCATPTQHLDDLWSFRISGENKKFTVIGNIHDNPELLRQTKLREAGK